MLHTHYGHCGLIYWQPTFLILFPGINIAWEAGGLLAILWKTRRAPAASRPS